MLAHIITSIKNKKSRRKSMDRDLERAGTDEKQWNNKVYWAKCIKSNEEAIVRWERWKELLTKAIEKGEDR